MSQPPGPDYGLPLQTRGEELANTITHGLGLALAIGATVAMVWKAALFGDAWHIVSSSIFGATLMLLYLTSTVYHGVRKPKLKRLWRIFDHSAIYLLIAGSGTPFLLVTLRGVSGMWSLLAAVWGVGLLGIIDKMRTDRRHGDASLAIYLIMGWMFVLAIVPLIELVPFGGLMWIIAGGLTYTAGVIFYLMDGRKFMHSVWHLFVLGGSFCHVMAVLLYVIPG